MTVSKIWLQSYPPGVPADIDPKAPSSLVSLFEQAVARFPAHAAYSSFGKTISYCELATLSGQFAAGLQSSLGMQQGARIALMMPNILPYPVCLYGALRAGCTVVNCNPLYTPRELAHQLLDSGAETIVILENFAHVLAKVRDQLPALKHIIVVRMGDVIGGLKGAAITFVVRHIKHLVPKYQLRGSQRFTSFLAEGAKAPPAHAVVSPSDIAFLQYTGGTTGVAKGAMLTHQNMVANVMQAMAWIRPVVQDGQEIIITALPLYHIFSLTANCLLFLRLGALNVLIPNPRDIPAFVNELKKHRFTAITGVNTLFSALLRCAEFSSLDFRALKISLGGGMAVQRKVAEQWLRTTGSPLIEAYGLTETSPAVTINPLGLHEYTGSIGLPVPSTEIVIRDANGNDQPLGSAGELCVRGPQVMRGYWQRPEETAQVLGEDGFLRTGDIAVMDSRGFLNIVDRKKDVILVSGFNVYPSEIEEVAVMHPAVLEAAAIGVADEHSGEVVKLFVVRKDTSLTVEALKAHCRANLTGYKRPHHIEFRDELPKSNVGKILRRKLKETTVDVEIA